MDVGSRGRPGGGFRRKPKLHCEREIFRASSSMENWTLFRVQHERRIVCL